MRSNSPTARTSICLLLGDIVSRTRFEDDREKPLVFQGETAAFHPRQGNVRVAASSVRNGFVAFSYSDEFQASISDRSLREARKSGSANNIRRPSIRHLARYARERLRLAVRSPAGNPVSRRHGLYRDGRRPAATSGRSPAPGFPTPSSAG